MTAGRPANGPTAAETQERIVRFIPGFTKATGFPPTYAEIAEHLGMVSKSSVMPHIQQLVRDGRVTQLPGSPRTLRVVEEAKP